jgi:uncharacterized protein YdeI (YjbR/CyaY-like superfamily)
MPAKSAVNVEVPPELTAALRANAAARQVFGRLPPSHKREHAGYVAEAKQVLTRERRSAKTVQALIAYGKEKAWI